MISGGISGAVNPMKCFVGGTMVAVFLGTMAIEDITPGTCVYAMDTETNEVALKEVVRTYENETSDVIRVTIGEETYTVTYGHPFYVEEKGFVDSENLKEGDNVVLLDRPENVLKDVVNEEPVPVSIDADNEKDKSKDVSDNQDTRTATVKSVEAVHLQEPVKVYNFEVADSHTYYVGEQGVLVHNGCGPDVGDGKGSYAQSGDKVANKGGVKAVDDLPSGWTKTNNNGFTHIKDADGKIRVRIDPSDAKTSYPHKHLYDAAGNSLDINGKIVSPKSPDAHIPLE